MREKQENSSRLVIAVRLGLSLELLRSLIRSRTNYRRSSLGRQGPAGSESVAYQGPQVLRNRARNRSVFVTSADFDLLTQQGMMAVGIYELQRDISGQLGFDTSCFRCNAIDLPSFDLAGSVAARRCKALIFLVADAGRELEAAPTRFKQFSAWRQRVCNLDSLGPPLLKYATSAGGVLRLHAVGARLHLNLIGEHYFAKYCRIFAAI